MKKVSPSASRIVEKLSKHQAALGVCPPGWKLDYAPIQNLTLVSLQRHSLSLVRLDKLTHSLQTNTPPPFEINMIY